MNDQSRLPHGSDRSGENWVSRLALQPLSAYKLITACAAYGYAELVEWVNKGQPYLTVFEIFSTLKQMQTLLPTPQAIWPESPEHGFLNYDFQF